MNTVILLTACVNPKGMAFTALQNADVRILQYVEAIKFYYQNTHYDICVCENTGFDFSPYIVDVIKEERNIEFITFNGNGYDNKLGKGYGEAIIIQYAIEHSVLIDRHCRIIKISGRYIVENIAQILEWITNFDCLHCKSQIIYSGQFVFEFCESFFIVAPTLFYIDSFLPRRYELNDSANFAFETLLFEEALRFGSYHNRKLVNLPFPLMVKGVSGSSGQTIITPTVYDKFLCNYRYAVTGILPVRVFSYRFLYSLKKKIKKHSPEYIWRILRQLKKIIK